MGAPCHIKYKYSPDYKAIYNDIILYFIAQMMTGLKILEDLQNK